MLPRWLITFRALALASVFAAAFVPIATYITDDKRDWLWIHIGVNIAAYIAVALTTIYTTISLTQQDHNKYRVPAYWANNIVMRTWYLGVSRTWGWHVAAAVGRLGLALALAQHVHIVRLGVDWTSGISLTPAFQGIFNQFLYYSYNSYFHNTEIVVRSQWETTLVAFVVLCGFAILETGLLTCWTLLVHYIVKRRLIGPFLLRSGLVIIFIGVMSQSQQIIRYQYQQRLSQYVTQVEKNASGNDLLFFNPVWHYYQESQPYRQFLRGVFRTGFTWLDNVTMLATWIMRPMTQAGFNHACTELDGEYAIYDDCIRYDNRPYILNDVLVALVGYTTYTLAIVASLQLAHYLHWRREQGMTTHAPTDASTA